MKKYYVRLCARQYSEISKNQYIKNYSRPCPFRVNSRTSLFDLFAFYHVHDMMQPAIYSWLYTTPRHAYIQILIKFFCNSSNPDTLLYVQDQNIISNISFELPSCNDRPKPRIPNPATSVKFSEFEKKKPSRFRGITFEALFRSKKRKWYLNFSL